MRCTICYSPPKFSSIFQLCEYVYLSNYRYRIFYPALVALYPVSFEASAHDVSHFQSISVSKLVCISGNRIFNVKCIEISDRIRLDSNE